MTHQTYLDHFKISDAKIHGLLDTFGEYQLTLRNDYYDALIRAIVGQQVSVKAAQAVYDKLRTRYNGILDPGILRKASQEELREAGISRQKARYINDLSAHFVDNSEIFETLNEQSDQEVIKALTAVKGIGEWTAQMFLMFTLGRLDVFPVDDLAIRKAMMQLYDFPPDSKKAVYVEKARDWAPYRSVACWYLWKSLH